jgi:hypothetical protein
MDIETTNQLLRFINESDLLTNILEWVFSQGIILTVNTKITTKIEMTDKKKIKNKRKRKKRG